MITLTYDKMGNRSTRGVLNLKQKRLIFRDTRLFSREGFIVLEFPTVTKIRALHLHKICQPREAAVGGHQQVSPPTADLSTLADGLASARCSKCAEHARQQQLEASKRPPRGGAQSVSAFDNHVARYRRRRAVGSTRQRHADRVGR